ncbi:hypothetical protein SAY87_012585 [Trapa incisa]|uniref:DNA-directed RNA polymerase subunit n=1 Tax=Trapa incisa TaxID=236973 RepID=A0AAN7JKA9_9MYRT|nr:hypothetical protein SAY87_012585 [Trapa incisa]
MGLSFYSISISSAVDMEDYWAKAWKNHKEVEVFCYGKGMVTQRNMKGPSPPQHSMGRVQVSHNRTCPAHLPSLPNLTPSSTGLRLQEEQLPSLLAPFWVAAAPGLILGMEGLKVSDANLVVCVHPSKIRRLSQAVLHDLSSLLFKFNEAFNGVVLAYDVGFVGEVAKILPAIHPYFGVKLNAKLLLFSPKPNMLLEGKVVKLTQESLHVIVLGFASAIITCEDIREEFTYKTIKGKEVYCSENQKHHSLKVGTMIRFMVKSMDEEILHIYGTLLADNTGSISWLDKDSTGPITDRCKKRSSENQRQTEQDASKNFTPTDDQLKKAKKR